MSKSFAEFEEFFKIHNEQQRNKDVIVIPFHTAIELHAWGEWDKFKERVVVALIVKASSKHETD